MSNPKVALNPKHPDRICWGCDKYCSANDLRCGNGTIRTPHPVELFGEDWVEWELNTDRRSTVDAPKPDEKSNSERLHDKGSSQQCKELLGLEISGEYVG